MRQDLTQGNYPLFGSLAVTYHLVFFPAQENYVETVR